MKIYHHAPAGWGAAAAAPCVERRNTVRQILKAAYPKQFARIIARYNNPNDPLDSFSEELAGPLLGGAFFWKTTSEGHDYWSRLARQNGW